MSGGLRFRIHQQIWWRLDAWQDKACEWSWTRDWMYTAPNRLLCALLGHIPTADHCNMPEHDHCAWCHTSLPFAADPVRAALADTTEGPPA